MKSKWFLFLALFLLTGSCLLAERTMEPALQTHEKNLGELQRKIEQLRQDQSSLKKDEQNLSSEIHSLEDSMKQSLIKQNYYNRRVLKTKQDVEKLKQEVEVIQNKEVNQETKLLASLQQYHIRASYPERLKEDTLLKLASQAQIHFESNALKTVIDNKNSALKKQQLKTEAQLEYEKRQQEWKKRAVDTSQEKQTKGKIYSQILKKKGLTEKELQELETNKAHLEKLIAQLRGSVGAAGMGEDLRRNLMLSLKGELPWPAVGTLISRFGRQKHPTLNIVTINNGIRIKTLEQAAVKAVAEGKVIFAAEFKAYGLTVILDHGGDFYSIYGLLSEINVEKGKVVGKGQVIGKINSNTEPQLYFEFRKSGVPQDPLEWLQ